MLCYCFLPHTCQKIICQSFIFNPYGFYWGRVYCTSIIAWPIRRESFEPSQTSLQREHKLSRKSHLKVRPFSDCPDCVLSFELTINILLHDRRGPVLSCYVCIISYWWGKFEIQWKSLGHAFYVNNFSVQERLTRESVYLYDGSMRCFLMRATWTRRKYLTYFGLWRIDTRSMYYFYTRAYENSWLTRLARMREVRGLTLRRTTLRRTIGQFGQKTDRQLAHSSLRLRWAKNYIYLCQFLLISNIYDWYKICIEITIQINNKNWKMIHGNRNDNDKYNQEDNKLSSINYTSTLYQDTLMNYYPDLLYITIHVLSE